MTDVELDMWRKLAVQDRQRGNRKRAMLALRKRIHEQLRRELS